MQGCRRRCRKREIRSYEKVKLTRLWRVMSQNARKWLTHLSSRSHWIKHPRAERLSSRRALISLHKHTDTDAQTYIKYKPRGMKMHRCWCVNTFILSQCRVGKTSGNLTQSVQPSELNWAVCNVGFASATCWTLKVESFWKNPSVVSLDRTKPCISSVRQPWCFELNANKSMLTSSSSQANAQTPTGCSALWCYKMSMFLLSKWKFCDLMALIVKKMTSSWTGCMFPCRSSNIYSQRSKWRVCERRPEWLPCLR